MSGQSSGREVLVTSVEVKQRVERGSHLMCWGVIAGRVASVSFVSNEPWQKTEKLPQMSTNCR